MPVMASVGLKHRTTKSYMAGIRHFHVEEGLGDPFLPTLPQLHYVLRGIKRSEGEEGATGRELLPITPPLLRRIKAVWDSDLDIAMLWAACCLAFFFFGFLRAGEFTVPCESGFDSSSHPSCSDLAVDVPGQPSVISVRLKASNTDPFWKRHYTFHWQGVFCPVPSVGHAALLASERQTGLPLVPGPGW